MYNICSYSLQANSGRSLLSVVMTLIPLEYLEATISSISYFQPYMVDSFP